MSNYGYQKKKKSVPVIFEPPCTKSGTGNRIHNALVTTVYDDLMHVEGRMSRSLVATVVQLAN